MLFPNSQSVDWNGVERRTTNGRRQTNSRRSPRERRLDNRVTSLSKQQLSLINLLRKLIRPRLGVDRRKGSDQRIMDDRRNNYPAPILTQEELSALLKVNNS